MMRMADRQDWAVSSSREDILSGCAWNEFLKALGKIFSQQVCSCVSWLLVLVNKAQLCLLDGVARSSQVQDTVKSSIKYLRIVWSAPSKEKEKTTNLWERSFEALLD